MVLKRDYYRGSDQQTALLAFFKGKDVMYLEIKQDIANIECFHFLYQIISRNSSVSYPPYAFTRHVRCHRWQLVRMLQSHVAAHIPQMICQTVLPSVSNPHIQIKMA